MAKQAPLSRTLSFIAGAVAQGASAIVPVIKAPFDGVVESVTYIPSAAITGANTNTRKLALQNRKQNGSATTEVAALQFNTGIDAVAYDEEEITLSGTAANREVAAGDVLAVASTAVGTGLADPGGLLVVTIGRS